VSAAERLARARGLNATIMPRWGELQLLANDGTLIAQAMAYPAGVTLLLPTAGFFEADLLPLKEAAHRAATTGDSSLVHPKDCVERQVPSYQGKQKGRVCF
jgi:hypothetical protein